MEEVLCFWRNEGWLGGLAALTFCRSEDTRWMTTTAGIFTGQVHRSATPNTPGRRGQNRLGLTAKIDERHHWLISWAPRGLGTWRYRFKHWRCASTVAWISMVREEYSSTTSVMELGCVADLDGLDAATSWRAVLGGRPTA